MLLQYTCVCLFSKLNTLILWNLNELKNILCINNNIQSFSFKILFIFIALMIGNKINKNSFCKEMNINEIILTKWKLK